MVKRRRIWAAAASVLVVTMAGAAAIWHQQRGTPPPGGAHGEAEHVHAAAEPATLRFFESPEALQPFTFETIDGRTMTSGDVRGKVTLVNFWATWCPPCRAEIPDLIALQKKYPEALQIVGISEDVGNLDTVKQFVAEHGITYPVVMATPEIEAMFTGVAALPTSFVLDRDVRVVQKHLGLLDPTVTELEVRALADLPVDAVIEYVDPAQPVGLEHAAQAKEIPGVDLASLTPARRGEALKALNAEPCVCGCGLTVAKCRVEDPACPVSLPLARQILDELQ